MGAFFPDGPVCFVSTHLDDVVLSCGHYIAAHPGADVVTVCTGAPAEHRSGTNEQRTGESYAPDALRVRRDEDAAALALLNARPRWLGFWEAEYVGARQPLEPIIESLRLTLTQLGAASVVAPLGLRHSDHVAVSDACLQLAAQSTLDWYVYRDLPYALTWPDAEQERFSVLAGAAKLLELEVFEPTTDIKHQAVTLYASQVEPASARHAGWGGSMSCGERYWRVELPDPANREVDLSSDHGLLSTRAAR